MVVLLCLTPVFKNMPQNAQGAVIIAAVIGLFNYSEWWFLWKVRPQGVHVLRCHVQMHLVMCSGTKRVSGTERGTAGM